MTETRTGFEPAKPLYAVVGAGGAAYQALTDVAAEIRTRTEQARTEVADRVETRTSTLREQISKLQTELPDDIAEIREKVTYAEVRRLTDTYRKDALDLYADFADRGETSFESFRERAEVERLIERIEEVYRDLLSRTDEAIDTAATQAKAATARATKLVGRETEEGENRVTTTVDRVAAAAKRAVSVAAPK